MNKLQHLVSNAHSLPLSVHNEIPEVEKISSTANSVGCVRSRIPRIADFACKSGIFGMRLLTHPTELAVEEFFSTSGISFWTLKGKL